MPNTSNQFGAFKIEAQYRDYVWGGNRLGPEQSKAEGQPPTAEAWVIYEDNRISSGPLAGQTLAEVAREYGKDFLGERVVARTQLRFPVLVKLLDCAQWLSLQVHPNNEQADQLEGPGHFGKAEAWYVLEADPGAEILCGFKPGTSQADWKKSVRDGSILDYAHRMQVHTGETIFIRPGTLHALGPGLLIYEIQQTSNLTYRVFDWNRPASSGRVLHIDQSLAVLDPNATGNAVPQPPFIDGGSVQLITSPYFTISMLSVEHNVVPLDPAGQTFHSLTVIEGEIEIRGADWSQQISQLESAVVPASSGPYQVTPLGRARVLKASVEE